MPKTEAERYIIPSRDQLGQSSREQFRCRPDYVRQMEIILASRKFPYITKSDIMRHALHELLAKLESETPIPDSLFRKIEMANEILRHEEIERRIYELMDNLEQAITVCLRDGDRGEVIRLVGMIRYYLDGGDQSYWTDKALERLKKYEKFLEGTGIKLI